MPLDLRLTNHPAKIGRAREAYGVCDHRRWLTRSARAGSDLFGSGAGAEQTPGADDARNGRCRTVRRLAMGAASEVFQPEILAGQEVKASQEVRISSDFADVIPLGEGQVALVLGDVYGKGHKATLCVSQTQSALRRILSECAHPACALSQLNCYLCGCFGLLGVGPVVTLSLAVVDVGAGTAVCACAGSEPPLILRANLGLEAVNAGRVALGVDASRAFRAVDFHMGTGDALLMATDGITGAYRADGSRDLLSYEGMAGLALDAFRAGGPPGQMARAVLDGAGTFAGGTLHDDASVLVAILR